MDLRCLSVLSFLLFLGFPPISALGSVAGTDEDFTEDLLLKPLPDRKVLSHFHFETSAPHTSIYGRHHRIFPKAVYQLVHKFRIREIELSFTQGRWNYERWGGFDALSSQNAKPPGVELWASFDVPPDEVDLTWKNLTHALSGLFCASINFLESSTAYSAPQLVPRFNLSGIRYGSLPREAVCTENLTPWLKLLPCRDKAGLAAILDRPSIYKGFYHSQRLHLVSSEFGPNEGVGAGIILVQTLTTVLQPDFQRTDEISLQPSWSISSIFGRKIPGQCVLARLSNVFLELEKGLVVELEKLGLEHVNMKGLLKNPIFELSGTPDKLVGEVSQKSSVFYEFNVNKYAVDDPLDLGITWKLPMVWSCLLAPFHATRFLMGSGNERGSIAISLRSLHSDLGLSSSEFEYSPLGKHGCTVRVVIFQVVPWYVKVYYHTLKIFIDGKTYALSDVIEKMHVSPSEDELSPGMMEIMFRLPCDMQSATIIVDFDKGFLHIDEYPPDANQGFDIPSAIVSFPDFHASAYLTDKSLSNESLLLFRFQEKNHVQSYTEVLLVPLTTPDFSMPYNVITFTCTVLALYFGSLLNVLRRRVGEEERFLKSEAAMKPGLLPNLLTKLSSKLRRKSPQPPSSSPPSSSSFVSLRLLLKVILVAVLAIVWHYYLNDN
ncbi:hypothetical protein QJS10_CPA10g01548 [Acorus calamus]|uniref:GPI transamidase component PIG-T n=1 Tax=Acorus calamus TaxID=4465 RepID=A0AAV9DZY1_ACOCL|nr:hypothetical protein QJS10_CPA10g01548 [Acorus calamus]